MELTRRSILLSQFVTPFLSGRNEGSDGLIVNWDATQFFITNYQADVTKDVVNGLVDQYVGTQVERLVFNVNAQKTSYASKAWEPIWAGYPDNNGDRAGFFAGTPANMRTDGQKMVDTAFRLNRKGIDPYALWMERARKAGISPWISIRTNDIHCSNDLQCFLHSDFWRQHRDYWRVPQGTGYFDRTFDYEKPEVRAYVLSLIDEVVQRYDIDGLELDWLREPYCLRPGREAAGRDVLSSFVSEVSHTIRKRKPKVAMGVRVPARPEVAAGFGFDVAAWARDGLVSTVVPAPRWATCDAEIPIQQWKQLVGPSVRVVAGIDALLQPYAASAVRTPNSLESARGFCASLLNNGSEGIYLFNYTNTDLGLDDRKHYPAMVREVAKLSTLRGKNRRHVVTYPDLAAPGKGARGQLPATISPTVTPSIIVDCGPGDTGGSATVRLQIEAPMGVAVPVVELNGHPLKFVGTTVLPDPQPGGSVLLYVIPNSVTMPGKNSVQVKQPSAGESITGEIRWVEVAINFART